MSKDRQDESDDRGAIVLAPKPVARGCFAIPAAPNAQRGRVSSIGPCPQNRLSGTISVVRAHCDRLRQPTVAVMPTWKSEFRLPPSPIAVGGQGEIFAATRKSDGTTIALKRVKDTHPDSIARMKREIQTQLSIGSSGTMPILSYDSDDWHWYAMPLAEAVLGAEEPPLADDMIEEVVRGVSESLADAHKKGFTHRDVNPGNIFRYNGRWVLGDWGCVRLPHGATTMIRTRTGMFEGTAGYAPPEVYESPHSLDQRADIYGLGRVIAWMVSGKHPTPNRPLVPDGKWRYIVHAATQENRADRPNCIADLLAMSPSKYGPPLRWTDTKFRFGVDLLGPGIALLIGQEGGGCARFLWITCSARFPT